MKSMRLVGALVLTVLLAATTDTLQYPVAKRGNVVDTFYGVAVSDPYRWMENDTSKEVEQWVQDEKQLAEDYLSKIPYRSNVLKRVKEVNTFNSMSIPWHRGKTTFYYSSDGESNHSVLFCQRDTLLPEVLIDPNRWSKDGTISLAFAEESKDARYMAFGKSRAGSDWHDIFIMDVGTKAVLHDSLHWVKNSDVSWLDNGFFYNRYPSSTNDESLYDPNSNEYICYHKLGTPQDSDRVVYRDTTHPNFYCGIYIPEDSPYLVLYQGDPSKKGNSIFIRPIKDSSKPWKKIYSNDNANFSPSIWYNGSLIGTTTLDAPNQRVVRIDDPMGKAKMETIIKEEAEPISGLSWGGGEIFVTRMVNVHDSVDIYNPDGKHTGQIYFPGKGNVGGFNGFVDDTVLYYSYASFTYPETIFKYDIKTGRSTPWYIVQAQFNPKMFIEQQVFVPSKDGTKIPMFLIYKKDLEFNGTAPTMMFGYGGFGITYGPGFQPNYIPWIEQGGVVAIPNLRGGGEYGEKWHDAGRKQYKQNVFDDAIACAEWLIGQNITSKDYLAINGRSNGGLLVGALITQRPDLFRVAVPEVGVMDMLRYHLFTVGHFWVSDYGTVENESEFKSLYAYSPYHNIRDSVEYPSTMVMTSDHDDRVVPAHSFKFTAQLQHTYKGKHPIILRIETRSGHGAVNREKALTNVADKYSFMWHEMGFTPNFEDK